MMAVDGADATPRSEKGHAWRERVNLAWPHRLPDGPINASLQENEVFL